MNEKYTVRSIVVVFLVFVAGLFQTRAQIFPVQATTQLTPPYSLYLADYVSSGTERLALNVYMADVARPTFDVRFRLRIAGQGITLETKPEYRPAPVTLQGGVPMRLISTDLADYFNPDNLNFQGMTRAEYNRAGKLPEGVYQFSFEVLDYNRGSKISNTGTATAWLVLNDPPIINLPANGTKLKAQDPQNVLLQWTPRHTGSPNSAFATEYDVTLVEVWPESRNPNDAILTSPPIFETTTSATTVLYGPAETPLEPGRRYAFRVRARSMAGMDEIDLFKNRGYSEVFTFVYGDVCDLPTGISITTVSSTKFGLTWNGLFNHTGYTLRYREVGTTNWYENKITLASSQVTGLNPGTTYEYQLAGTCGFYSGNYTPIAQVKTDDAPAGEYACGVPLTPFDLDPAQLAGSLKVGDIIQAGDFDVKLTKVSGSNGTFTGEGVIEVPFFNKARANASFTSATINKELRLVNGELNVTGGKVQIVPEKVLEGIDKLDEILEDVDKWLDDKSQELNQPKWEPVATDRLIELPNTISDVKTQADGTVVITDKAGNKQTLPPGTSAAITDTAGKGYLVDSKGNVYPVTAEKARKVGNRELNLILTFDEHKEELYGFDRLNPNNKVLTQQYEALSGGYSVPWKSMASGGQDDVDVLLGQAADLDKSKIHFEAADLPLSAPPLSGEKPTLNFSGGTAGDKTALVALYTPAEGEKEQVLGKLNVATYDEIPKSVVIVPVGNISVPSGLTKDKISEDLNDIFGQGVVKWSVRLAEPMDYTLPSPFDDGETGVLSNYTSDMRAVIRAYGTQETDTYYLFLVANAKSGEPFGMMPRSKHAGFIFLDKHQGDVGAITRTMAHELAHGAFNLHHTFQEPNYALTKGQTDNLMDYPAGSKLYKFQWDKIRCPDIVVGVLEDDDEAYLAGSVAYDEPDEVSIDEPVANPAEMIIPTKDLAAGGCNGNVFLTKYNRLIELSDDVMARVSHVRMAGRYLIGVTVGDKVYNVRPGYTSQKLNTPQRIDDKIVEYEITGTTVGLVCDACITPDMKKTATYKEFTQSTHKDLASYRPEIQLPIKSSKDCVVGTVFITHRDGEETLVCDFISEGDVSAEYFAVIRNYTAMSLQDSEELRKLFIGAKPMENRHNLKAILFLTDERLKEKFPEKYKEIKEYLPEEGTVKIWLHFDDKKWIIPEGAELTRQAEQFAEIYKKASSGNDFMESLLKQFNSNEGGQAAVATYEFLDWVAQGLDSIKVPQYVWNCDKKDVYDDAYRKMYSTAIEWVFPIRGAVREYLESVAANDAGKTDLVEALNDYEKIEIAVAAGVWDGLIEILAGVPRTLSTVDQFLKNEEKWHEFTEKLNQLRFYVSPVSGKRGIFAALRDGIGQTFNRDRPCELAYNTSSIATGFVIAIVDPPAISSRFGKVVGDVVATLKEIQALEDAVSPWNQVGEELGKMAFKSFANSIAYAWREGQYVWYVMKNGTDVPIDIDWTPSTYRTMQLAGADGGMVSYDVYFGDGADGYKTFNMGKVITDDNGRMLHDASNNSVGLVTDGKTNQRVAIRLSAAAIKEILDKLKNKFPNIAESILQNLARAKLNDLDDFLDNNALITHINESGYAATFLSDLTRRSDKVKVLGDALKDINIGLFEKWKACAALGSDKGGFGARRRIDYDFLNENDYPAAKLSIDINTVHAQQMIDDYGCKTCSDNMLARGDINPNTIKLMDANGDVEDIIGFGNKDWVDIYEGAYKDAGRKTDQSWKDYFEGLKKLKINGLSVNGFQAHHIFPVDLFNTCAAWRHYFMHYKGAKGDILDFNAKTTRQNTIMLEAFAKGRGVHTNHDDYTEAIQLHLDDYMKRLQTVDKITDEVELANKLHDRINVLSGRIKIAIIEQGLTGPNSLLEQSGKHVNDLDFAPIFKGL